MRLQSRRSARSNRLSECLLCHFMDIRCRNGGSWRTGQGAWQPQSLTNAPTHIWKVAGHLSIIRCFRDVMLPTITQRKPLAAQWSQDCSRNIVMFIGLLRRVCLVRRGSALQLESESVWIVRWCIFYNRHACALLSCITSARTDANVVTIVTCADRSVQSSDVWTQQIRSDPSWRY